MSIYIIGKGKNIFCFSDEEMRKVRGNEIAYIPQGTGNALNPVIKIVSQVAEPLMVHRGFSKKDARRKAIALLDRMDIKNAAKRAFDYPHHYSGGMKERALVAMAIASEADILLADEPTKGLDWKKREDVLSIFLNLNSKIISCTISFSVRISLNELNWTDSSHFTLKIGNYLIKNIQQNNF